MSREVWPGMGSRIDKRIKELGYSGVERFTQAHPDSKYTLGLVYKWIRGDVAPSRQNILRLAADLDCDPAYLIFGTPKPAPARRPAPISGGSGAAAALAVGKPGGSQEASPPAVGQRVTRRDIMSTTRVRKYLQRVPVRPLQLVSAMPPTLWPVAA